MNDKKNKIESVLFMAGDLIEIKDIAKGLEVDGAEIRKQVSILADEYDARNAGLKIVWVKDSVQMSTREDYADDISNETVVISVNCEEIQKSPSYSSGYALRFPRFFALRSDKPVDEIMNIDTIEEMYFTQRGRN